MTWVTERVIAGEIAHNAEARQSQLAVDWDMAEVPAHTGRWSAQSVGPGAGLGHSYLPTITSMRAGWWWNAHGWWTPSVFKFVQANRYSSVDPRVETPVFDIRMNWDSYGISLYEYWESLGGYVHLQSYYDVTALLGKFNDWQHCAFYYNRTTRNIKFWVNGVEFIDTSLVLAEDDATKIYVAAHGDIANSGGNSYIDDIYFDGSTSSESSSIPPARRFYSAVPNGVGNYTQWTPLSGSNYQNVDETGVADEDTTYVSTAIDNLVDTYTFEDLLNVYPEIDIDGVVVQVFSRMRPVDGTGYIKTKVRLSGTDDESNSIEIFQEKESQWSGDEYFLDWCVINGWFPLDPSSAVWTETNFNNAEFGVESDVII